MSNNLCHNITPRKRNNHQTQVNKPAHIRLQACGACGDDGEYWAIFYAYEIHRETIARAARDLKFMLIEFRAPKFFFRFTNFTCERLECR